MEKEVSHWDARIMDDREQVKHRLFKNIVAEIQHAETAVVPLRRQAFRWRVVAAAAVLTACFFAAYTFRIQILNAFFPVRTLEAYAVKGKLLKTRLSDGTIVWLNSDSKLRYPEAFRDSIREVSLTGEAYFEVAHNAEKPFVIQSNGLATRVLGTRFVVKSYAGDKLSSVAVLSGKVSVSKNDNPNSNSVMLVANQEVTADQRSGLMQVKNGVDTLSMMSWTDGKLLYRKSPLFQVIDDLKRRFEIEITAEPHLMDCLIYADVLPEDQPQLVLDQLAVSLEGKVKQISKTEFSLTGKGCK
jgi:transmembrane sensor